MEGPIGVGQGSTPAPYTQSTALTGKKVYEKNKGAEFSGDLTDKYDKAMEAGVATADQNFKDFGAALGAESASKYDFGIKQLGDWNNNPNNPDNPEIETKLRAGLSFADKDAKDVNFDTRYAKASLGASPIDFNQLGTSAGLQVGLRDKMQNQGQNYSRGMSAIDAGIYLPSSSIQGQVGSLMDHYGSGAAKLADYEKRAGDTAPEGVTGYVPPPDTLLGQEQRKVIGRGGAVKKGLQGLDSGLDLAAEGNAASALQADANNTNFGVKKKSAIDQLMRDYAPSLFKDYGADSDMSLPENASDTLKKYLNSQGSGKYYSQEQSAGPYYSAAQAAQKNRIGGLLGNGANFQAGTTTGTFDDRSLRRDLEEKAKKWVSDKAKPVKRVEDKSSTTTKDQPAGEVLRNTAKKAETAYKYVTDAGRLGVEKAVNAPFQDYDPRNQRWY